MLFVQTKFDSPPPPRIKWSSPYRLVVKLRSKGSEVFWSDVRYNEITSQTYNKMAFSLYSSLLSLQYFELGRSNYLEIPDR